MAAYAAIQGGVITNVIEWDGITPYAHPGVTLTLASSLTGVVQAGSTVVGSVCSAPAVAAQTSGLTFQQYASLFTSAEFNAIATLATTNPGVFVGIMKAISYSGNLDLNSPFIINQLAALVTAGTINAARQTAIRAGVISNPAA